MKQETTEYGYRVAAWCAEGQSGVAKSDTAPNTIQFSSQPNGLKGRWTPEELLLASLAGCFTTTFRTFALREKCDFVDIELEATAKVARVDSAGFFNDIVVHSDVTIRKFEDCNLALKLLEAAERECLIRRALDFPIKFEAHVHLGAVEHLF